jgi:hypothetical protein
MEQVSSQKAFNMLFFPSSFFGAFATVMIQFG